MWFYVIYLLFILFVFVFGSTNPSKLICHCMLGPLKTKSYTTDCTRYVKAILLNTTKQTGARRNIHSKISKIDVVRQLQISLDTTFVPSKYNTYRQKTYDDLTMRSLAQTLFVNNYWKKSSKIPATTQRAPSDLLFIKQG